MDEGVAFFFNTQVLCFCCSKIAYLFICSSQKLQIEWEQLNLCCISEHRKQKIWLVQIIIFTVDWPMA